MKGKIISIKEDFLNEFPQIYQKPSKINKYLKKYSNKIEIDIKNKFKKLELDKNFAIYANGGFGRKEMFPSSDIDLSIVELNKIQDYGNLEKFISFMWDRGYKVGHSVRSINDIKKISKNDLKEFTSYLTRRAIISNQNIDNKITKALNGLWTRNNFYNQKFIEQQRRHSEFHSSAYNLEPDLKESPGTLRDFQSALWILQHCYGLDSQDAINKSGVIDGEFKKAIEAYNFIKSLRFATNIATQKNRLNFEAQIEVSKYAKLNKKSSKASVEKMMKNYYENASILSYFNEIIFEKYNEKKVNIFSKKISGIYKNKNKIGIRNIDIKKNKDLIFQIFIEIGKNKNINLIDTPTKSLIKKNINLIDEKFIKQKIYSKQFLEILRSKYNLSSILKTMKNLGVLQAYIPEFANVVGQMQFDLFHIYTVDEHTFKVVRNMRQMKLFKQKGFELEYELINKIPKIEILYLAGIFHDLGKGKGGDHSDIGAKISYDFAIRIGMSETDAGLISWLVKEHLIMSSISQKKDIGEAETIIEFAKQVEQSEKLDYLYLLTINDIRATNPALWNGWKHQLLKDLYILTRSKINKEPLIASSSIALERKKNTLLAFSVNDGEVLESYLSNLGNSYFNKNLSESLKWQAALIVKNKDKDLIVGCKNIFENLIEIFIKVKNSKGLFYKFTKILEHSGLEVIDANIFSSTDNTFAANTFITKFSHHDRKLLNSDLIELKKRIEKNFTEFNKIKDFQKKSIKKNRFEKVINISNSINKDKGRNLITIETSDSQGLLANIAKVFFDNNVSIFSARINTLGDRVEDTFEIENHNKTLLGSNKIEKIVADLEKVV
jgi:[protein-PII] uridylyltransferase